jgi:ABC-type lipoprotein export system ATPase subunit
VRYIACRKRKIWNRSYVWKTYINLREGDSLVEVLKGVSFSVEKENSSPSWGLRCGKSNLLYLLGALDSPDQGSVFIHDQDINK